MGVTAIPYDSNGVATVTRQLAVTGQTIEAVQVNVPFADIQSMLSQVLLRSGVAPMTGNLNLNGFKITNLSPATADGNAVEYSQLVLKADSLQPYVNVASAGTTDIGAAASQNVKITGTTTITSFGTVSAGTIRDVVFTGILTLTNSASLILPFGANITTAAGESLRAVSEGSGVWRVTEYQKNKVPTLTVGDGLTSTGSIAGGNMTVALDIYNGNTPGNATFAVGESVIVFAETAILSRNGLIIPAISTSDSTIYVRSVSGSAGTLLDGTWRTRGSFDVSGNKWYRAVRVG